MVKLRVAARVIPEDDYLRTLERPTAAVSSIATTSERRLLVIVREPHRWQIGTLALEVQRAYKSCYGHDLPTVKYLKDNDDDCDLDPQLYVSDLLVDEGRAARDGADQRVTIKVILEQGRAVREGSVAIGSQLDNQAYHLQLQRHTRPPVPAFPGLQSSLGKRPFPQPANGVKRPRQLEIQETQREDMVSSIEHETESLLDDVVQDTQPPHLGYNDAQFKAESPELGRTFEHVAPPTADELEELAQPPVAFAPRHRASMGIPRVQGHSALHRQNGVEPAFVSGASHQHHALAPITPPTDPALRRSVSLNFPRPGPQDVETGPRQPSTLSASKFKRRDVYDFPESDIDDSQMSPRSRQALPGPQTSLGRVPQGDRLRSPYGPLRELPVTVPAPEDTLPRRAMAVVSHTASTDNSEDDIYEDAPADESQLQLLPDFSQPQLSPANTEANKENENLVPFATESVTMPVISPPVTAQSSQDSAISTHSDAPLPSTERPATEVVEKKKRNRRKRGSETISSIPNGEVSNSTPVGPIGSDAVAHPSPRVSQKKRKQATPCFGGPDEQLSQLLQESAQKQTKLTRAPKTEATAAKAKKSDAPKPVSDKPGPDKPGPAKKGPAKKELAKKGAADAKKAIVGANAEQGTPTPVNAGTGPPKEPETNMSSDPAVKPSVLVQIASAKSPPSSKSGPEPQPNPPTGGKTAETRSNISMGAGLSEEELKIVESRKGMTKEQYEADKKRKRDEAEKLKKKEAAARRDSSLKPALNATSKAKCKTPTVEVPAVRAKTPNVRKSLTADAASKAASEPRSPKSGTTAAPEQPKSTTSAAKSATAKASDNSPEESSESSSTSSESSEDDSSSEESAEPPTTAGVKGQVKPVPKTHSKTSSSSSSIKQAKSSTPTKENGAKSAPVSASKGTATRASPSTGTSRPVPVAAIPTISTARSLQQLRDVLNNGKRATDSLVNRTIPRASTKPDPKRSILGSEDDDNDDDDSSSDDNSESDSDEPRKPATATGKSGGSSTSSDSSSGGNDDLARKKTAKVGRINGTGLVRASATPKAKKPALGQPDPSIRDRTPESDSDDEDSD